MGEDLRQEGTWDCNFQGRKFWSTLQVQEQRPKPIPEGNVVENEGERIGQGGTSLPVTPGKWTWHWLKCTLRK